MAYRVESLGNHKYKLHYTTGTGDDRLRKTKTVEIHERNKDKEMATANMLAQQFAAACANEITVAGKELTFEEFATTWLKLTKPDVKITTYNFYKSIVQDRLIPAFGKKPLREISPTSVKLYYNKLLTTDSRLDGQAGSVTPTTVNGFHRTFKAMLNDAVMWELLDNNPLDRVKPPKKNISKSKTGYLSEDEIAKVMFGLNHTMLWFQTFVIMALYTGMRRGEILGLKWSDYYPEKHLIAIERTRVLTYGETVVKDTKTKSGARIVSLPPTLEFLLMRLYHEQSIMRQIVDHHWQPEFPLEKNWIFVNYKGQPLYPSSPYNKWRRFLKEHGIRHIPLHGLRHTAATIMLDATDNINAVADRLGHSRPSTTVDIYGHVFKRSDQKLSDNVEKYVQSICMQNIEEKFQNAINP